MNSSMKQPQPSGVSLNDCLLKGPPALADLYTVTLGIREHKVAFTKDISKFYQCVEADEAAQHVRRILWRFGDKSKEPTIFVTTRVNYGDRPGWLHSHSSCSRDCRPLRRRQRNSSLVPQEPDVCG